MPRIVLFLLIMLILAPLGFSGGAAHAMDGLTSPAHKLAMTGNGFVPSLEQGKGQTETACGASAKRDACITHEDARSSAPTGCDPAQSCGACTLCHSCHQAVLADEAAHPSTPPAFHLPPTRLVADYPSAERAPHFKPPIL